MDKETGNGKKDGRWDETKPGTIVAGPEAHENESAGEAPSDRREKPKDERSEKPAG